MTRRFVRRKCIGRRKGSFMDDWVMKIAWGILILGILYMVVLILTAWLNKRAPQDIKHAGDLVINPMTGLALGIPPWGGAGKGGKGKRKAKAAAGGARRKGDAELSVPFWIIFSFVVMLVVLIALRYLSTYLTKVPALIGSKAAGGRLI